MLRLANLQIISPERIVLLLTTDNLNDLCRQDRGPSLGLLIKIFNAICEMIPHRSLNANVGEINHEFKQCLPLDKDNLYWLLFQGVVIMQKSLCQSETPLVKSMFIECACR